MIWSLSVSGECETSGCRFQGVDAATLGAYMHPTSPPENARRNLNPRYASMPIHANPCLPAGRALCRQTSELSPLSPPGDELTVNYIKLPWTVTHLQLLQDQAVLHLAKFNTWRCLKFQRLAHLLTSALRWSWQPRRPDKEKQ